MYCSACGAQIEAQARFCSSCGAATAGGEESAEQAPASPPPGPAEQPPAFPPPATPPGAAPPPSPAAPDPAWGAPRKPSVLAGVPVGPVLLAALQPVALGLAAATLISGLIMGIWWVAMDDMGWSVVDWFRAMILTVSAALGGALNVDAPAGRNDDYGYVAHLTLWPTTVSAILLGVTAGWAWWRARLAAKTTAAALPVWARLGAAAIAGVGAALVVCIAAALSSLPLTERSSAEESLTFGLGVDTTVRLTTTSHFSTFVWTLLVGSLLLTAAGMVGPVWWWLHEKTTRQGAESSTQAEPGWLRHWRSWRAQLGTVVVWLAVGLVAGLLVLLVCWLVLDDDKLSSLAVALIAIPTVLAYAWAFLLGMNPSVHHRDLETNYGLLHGDRPAWMLVLLLIALLLTVVVGVRAGLRQGTRGRWPGDWWKLLLLMMLTWIGIGILTRVAIESSRVYSSPSGRDYYQSLNGWAVFSDSYYLSPGSLLLMALLWGLLLLVAQTWLTEVFVALLPRWSRALAGKGISPQWQQALATSARVPSDPQAPPAPEGEAPASAAPARLNKRVLLTLIAVGAVLLALVAAVVGVALVNRMAYSPEKSVEKVFSAINDGDVSTLSSLMSDWPDDPGPLLNEQVLKATHQGEAALTDVEVTELNGEDKNRSATVTYRVAGQTQTEHLTLTRANAKRWGVFQQWKVSGLVSSLTGNGSTSYKITGVDQAQTGTLHALPGRYEVKAADPGGPGVQTPSESVVVGQRSATVNPVVSIDEQTRQRILLELDAYIGRCTASGVAKPPACPFMGENLYSAAPTDPVTWWVYRQPSQEAKVDLDSQNHIQVSGQVVLQYYRPSNEQTIVLPTLTPRSTTTATSSPTSSAPTPYPQGTTYATYSFAVAVTDTTVQLMPR